jgi:hypothetical protein
MGGRSRTTQQAGWFPLSSCQGLLTCTFTNRITLLLQFCQGKKREEKQRRARGGRGEGRGEKRSRSGSEGGRKEARTQKRCEDTHRQESTSEREYEVDA